MLVKTFGAAVQGIDATPVTIEVNSSRGIRFFLVGLLPLWINSPLWNTAISSQNLQEDKRWLM